MLASGDPTTSTTTTTQTKLYSLRQELDRTARVTMQTGLSLWSANQKKKVSVLLPVEPIPRKGHVLPSPLVSAMGRMLSVPPAADVFVCKPPSAAM